MKVYPLGIVGEAHCQQAIEGCSAGEPVRICHEPDNPFDNMALRVETRAGEKLGYIAKSSWLRDAIHEQGRGVTATILSINDAEGGKKGVVLNVTLTDDDLPERFYGEDGPPDVIGAARSAFATGATVANIFRKLIK